jgi:DNA mismatch repair protein MutS2
VLASEGDRLRLQVGAIKLILRGEDVEPAQARPKQNQPRAHSRKSSIATSALPTAVRTAGNTLDLRGERVEEALAKVDSFADRLLRIGEPYGFVLHGHGTGALKSAVREHLKASSVIEQSAPADPDSGGDAFTIFWLRC